jgi:lipopolysaccharide/colanic/teichoic acid biosynthesis glycosyltransferase
MTRGIKRLLDLTAASLARILFAPVMALLAPAIQLTIEHPRGCLPRRTAAGWPCSLEWRAEIR